MKVSELVAQARDELFKGWAKGTLSDGQNVCAVGALRRATMANLQNGAPAVFKEAREALNLKAGEMSADVGMPFATGAVESFNDFYGTKKEDVLNLFDKATISLEEQGR